VVSRRWGTGSPVDDFAIRFRWGDLIGVPLGVVTQLAFVPLLYVPLRWAWPDTFTTDEIEQRARDLADRAGGWLTVVLVLVVVAGSVRRLWLYEQAYGLTVLRFASLVFALWIACIFVLLGVALAGRGRTKAWFVPAAVALGLVGLFACNVANPEALIVERNVDRFGATDRLDVSYLVGLSDDAVPALVRSLPALRPDAAAVVLDDVCAGERRLSGGFWGFNAGRRAAIDARTAVCP